MLTDVVVMPGVVVQAHLVVLSVLHVPADVMVLIVLTVLEGLVIPAHDCVSLYHFPLSDVGKYILHLLLYI